jgi:hypothetical protein
MFYILKIYKIKFLNNTLKNLKIKLTISSLVALFVAII